MLTEKQILELREMAASEALREEFRTLARNSRRIESKLTVDQWMHWLTEISQVFPESQKPRRFINYSNVRF